MVSVLASTLIPGILGYRLTLLNENRLLYGAPEGSFRDHFYFDIFGVFLIRLFFFGSVLILVGCWCSQQSKTQSTSCSLE